MNVYAARIATARKLAGLSQQDLADALGVNVQTIKRRESAAGKAPKKVDRIAIATVCGVSIDYMEGVITDVESAADAVVRKLREHDAQLHAMQADLAEISDLHDDVRKLARTVAQQSRELRALRDLGRRDEPPADGQR
jgi:transcriptional regulator with XRE-family HTH domain